MKVSRGPVPPGAQFSFGRTPPAEAEDEALTTPCFAQCPTRKPHKGAGCPGIEPAL
jgi:hypothetical protein